MSRWQDGRTVAATGPERHGFPAPDGAAERMDGDISRAPAGARNILVAGYRGLRCKGVVKGSIPSNVVFRPIIDSLSAGISEWFNARPHPDLIPLEKEQVAMALRFFD